MFLTFGRNFLAKMGKIILKQMKNPINFPKTAPKIFERGLKSFSSLEKIILQRVYYRFFIKWFLIIKKCSLRTESGKLSKQ